MGPRLHREALVVWLRVAALRFGGPAGQIAAGLQRVTLLAAATSSASAKSRRLSVNQGSGMQIHLADSTCHPARHRRARSVKGCPFFRRQLCIESSQGQRAMLGSQPGDCP